MQSSFSACAEPVTSQTCVSAMCQQFNTKTSQPDNTGQYEQRQAGCKVAWVLWKCLLCQSSEYNVNDVFTPAPSISLRRHRDSIRVPWFVSERVLMSWTLCLPPKLESLKVQLKLQEFPCRVQSSIFLHVLNPWPPRWCVSYVSTIKLNHTKPKQTDTKSSLKQPKQIEFWWNFYCNFGWMLSQTRPNYNIPNQTKLYQTKPTLNLL